MKKPANLRAFLELRTPWLNVDPDHLVILVENGQIAATGAGACISYQYQYMLTITLLDFARGPEEVIIPIMEWLKTHQPDLLDNSEWQRSGLAFDLTVIDKSKVDLTLRLQLTEDVLAKIKDGAAQEYASRYEVQVLDEPQPGALLE